MLFEIPGAEVFGECEPKHGRFLMVLQTNWNNIMVVGSMIYPNPLALKDCPDGLTCPLSLSLHTNRSFPTS
jgi:hypothetical protein